MTPSTDTRTLIDGLKRMLRRRGITYAQVAEALGLSLPTIKRQLSRGSMSIERLVAICAVAHTDLYELARAARAESARTPCLDLEQEQSLAASEPLMLVFHLLLAGWKVEAICDSYQFHAASMSSILAQLEAVKLIAVEKDGEARLLVPHNLVWQHQGPVMRRYGDAAMQEFLRGRFDGKNELLALETRELTAASLLLLKRKFELLQHEFIEFAELDAAAPATESRHNVGMVLALRPWTFSIARARQRAQPAATQAMKP